MCSTISYRVIAKFYLTQLFKIWSKTVLTSIWITGVHLGDKGARGRVFRQGGCMVSCGEGGRVVIDIREHYVYLRHTFPVRSLPVLHVGSERVASKSLSVKWAACAQLSCTLNHSAVTLFKNHNYLEFDYTVIPMLNTMSVVGSGERYKYKHSLLNTLSGWQNTFGF